MTARRGRAKRASAQPVRPKRPAVRPQEVPRSRRVKVGLWAGGVVTAVVVAVVGAIGTGLAQRVLPALFPAPAPSTSQAVTPSSSQAAKPQIEVDDLVISTPNQGVNPSTSIDLKLRNIGTQLTIVKRAVLTIRRSAPLPLCASQGFLPASAVYGTVLPTNPAPGQQVTVSLSEQISAGQADRFKLTLSLPPQALHTGTIFLYSIDISLLHDASSTSVNAGHVTLLMPTIPPANQFSDDLYFLTPYDVQHKSQDFGFLGSSGISTTFACLRSNNAKLREFLAAPGYSAQELKNMVAQLAS
jgi:hypothetical protein